MNLGALQWHVSGQLLLECRAYDRHHYAYILIYFVCQWVKSSKLGRGCPALLDFSGTAKSKQTRGASSVIPRLTNVRKLSASFLQLQTLAQKLCRVF